MKTKDILDVSTLVGIAKQVSLSTIPPSDISSIIYNYDDTKSLSVDDHNKLLKFIHESSSKWQRPKSNGDMITEILVKIGYGERINKNKYSSYVNVSSPPNKEEIRAIHAWIMNPERK